MKTSFLFSVFIITLLCNTFFSQGLVILKQDTTKLYAAIVGKHQRDKITKTELLAATKLDLMNNADSAYHIVSFQLLEVCRGGGPVIFNTDSDKISDNMHWAFNSLTANNGCKVYFQEIKCVGVNKDTIEAPSFLLFVP